MLLFGEGNSVISCNNSGEVTGDQNVGGIIGYGDNTEVDNCSNNGIIIGNGILDNNDKLYHVNAGGIIGMADGSSTITDTHNNNEVKTVVEESKTKLNFGGITGFAGVNSTITKCHNGGNIGILNKTMTNVGGICGESKGTITKCYNTGTISANSNIGGIVGIEGWYSNSCVGDCYNSGNITVIVGSAGGISYVPGTTYKSEIKNCYNVGKITVKSATNNIIGSIVGTSDESKTTVTNCYYLSGTYNGGINGKDIEGQAEKKEKDKMITQEFVDKLNEGNEEVVWIKDEKNEYPVLK